ncbi:MAG: putative quinol monooxygenase [Chloroflexota bacterium]|nr:putative quinol monooxygenase [Chloroflexota bacterium]
MIVVAATLMAAEGKGDELEQQFKALVPKCLGDPGTVAYAVHRGLDDPSKFLVYEKYASGDALKAHSQTPHFKEFSQAISSLVQGRADIALYQDIA